MTRPVEQFINGAFVVKLEYPHSGYGVADGQGTVCAIKPTIEQARKFALSLPTVWPDEPKLHELNRSPRALSRR